MASLNWENQSTFQPGVGGEDCPQENKTLGSAHFLSSKFDYIDFEFWFTKVQSP